MGNWAHARDKCVELGMQLAVIKDANTYDAVEAYLTSNGYT